MSEKKILVVEDEMPLQRAILQKLERNNRDAIGVRTVPDALAALEAEGDAIEAIWLDHYLLGEHSGLDFVRMLKESGDVSGEHGTIPIFVVSNTASDPKIKEYIALGITEYFVKATNRLEQIIQDITQQLEPAR